MFYLQFMILNENLTINGSAKLYLCRVQRDIGLALTLSLPKQVGVCSSTFEYDAAFLRLVNEKPIGLNMALPSSLPVAN
jgi:hypothetical protein